MTDSQGAARTVDALAALLRREEVAWGDLKTSSAELLDVIEYHGLTTLVHQRLRAAPEGWPEQLQVELTAAAHAKAACEMQREREIVSVVSVLAAEGLRAILLKGTPLAYTIYDAPSLRPRSDTDLLIRHEDVARVKRIMNGRGYSAPVQCEGDALFSQFELGRTDEFGLYHAFDFHWRISTQPVFAEMLAHDELLERAEAVPALGPGALAAGKIDALLIACVHPVMHHRNVTRLLWTYDIHLIALTLSATEFTRFVELAREKGISAICAHQLHTAKKFFKTPIPASLMIALSAPADHEPSAEYLRGGRRWHDELISSVRALPSLGARVRLFREVLFPNPRYMLAAYGLTGKPLGAALLPALYLHRNVAGALKVLTGRK